MRKIEFRGKSLSTDDWIYGALYPTKKKAYIFRVRWVVLCEEKAELEKQAELIEIDPQTIGQNTGLEDMRGTEIFEGDVVRMSGNVWSWFRGRRALVLYRGGQFVIAFGDSPEKCEKAKKYPLGSVHKKLVNIGNVHDDPEILREAVK